MKNNESDEILKKEAELAKLKNELLAKNWKDYLDKLKKFLDKLIGKTLLSWTNDHNLYMYKVIGYKEQYYVDVDGFYGQSGFRWYELKTTGSLQISVPCNNGEIYEHAPIRITENSHYNDDVFVPFNHIKLVKIKGKHKDQIIFPKFIFKEHELVKSCSDAINQVVAIGKLNYNEKIPDYDRSIRNFLSNSVILENDNIFNKALEIYKKHTMEVLSFYEEFNKELRYEKKEYSITKLQETLKNEE